MRVNPLLLTVALCGLAVADGDKPRDCPLCGGHEVTFDDSADGAFKRFRFAVVTQDVDLLRECTEGAGDKFFTSLEQASKAWEPLLAFAGADAEAAKVDGESATIRLRAKKGDTELLVARSKGAWRIRLGPILEATRRELYDRDCTNNLRQIGTYIVMWTAKFGNDRVYPGPGLALLTMLTEPKTRIMAEGNEGLLFCRSSGEELNAEAIRRGDAAAISYECCETTLSDAKTPVDAPIAWDKKPCHDGKRHVLFFAGNVETLTEEQFQEARKRWK